MRPFAISIVVLSGGIMAVGGTIAEAMPGAKHYNIVDELGVVVVAIGLFLLIAELLNWRPFSTINDREKS